MAVLGRARLHLVLAAAHEEFAAIFLEGDRVGGDVLLVALGIADGDVRNPIASPSGGISNTIRTQPTTPGPRRLQRGAATMSVETAISCRLRTSS